MTKRIATLAALLLAGSLTLAACGNSNNDANPSGGSTTSSDFNDADVTFAQSMIPHHQQAVQMAKMAPTQASSPEVKQLAAQIEAAQAPEIEQMTQWLEDWGQQTSPSDEGDGVDHGDMGGMDGMDVQDMPGMMDDAQMRDLQGAKGAAWDGMFLTMMIAHHEGAIEMAKTEQADGKNPDAIALAKKIEEAQTAEIATMRDLIAS